MIIFGVVLWSRGALGIALAPTPGPLTRGGRWRTTTPHAVGGRGGAAQYESVRRRAKDRPSGSASSR
ncbi:hypothetical protein ACWD1Y_44955 [Streptomyces sp. NPDC002814]